MSEDKKDLFPTKRLKVHDSRYPGFETIIISHDISDTLRETFDLEKKKQDKPADVIPLRK